MSFLQRLNFFKFPEALLYSRDSAEKVQRSIWRPDDVSLIQIRKTLERILRENIVPFWYPEVIDDQDGGYRLNHDLKGKWKGPANKRLVTQARTLWFFSRLANSKYGNSEFLAAATHGYAFFRDRMWDKEFGGFYWEVDSAGHAATAADKHTYGQAFALFALTEYSRVSGDVSAQTKAKELFSLMDDAAHETANGGYRDICRRDWSPGSTIKRMNTHMHLMEAMTCFLAWTNEAKVRERLIELILINSNAVVRKGLGACTDQYLENWKPLRGPKYDRVSYGHGVENLWLLAQACASAGIPASLLLDLYKTLFTYALRYGYDRQNGGFYDSGSFLSRADRREKIWWVQAEGLVSALQMYRLTAEEVYWNCFSQTLEWIVKHQVDWQHGDWHETIDRAGKASGVKAGPWKGPYHNGRAMLQCLELLLLACKKQ
jgi:mannobiose 2-epimerase